MKTADSICKMRRRENQKFITISILDLLNAVENLPYILSERSRIESAKNYWLNYSKDNRYLCNRTGERSEFLYQTIEMPEVYYKEDGKLAISDGNHRIVAFCELGYTEVICEL